MSDTCNCKCVGQVEREPTWFEAGKRYKSRKTNEIVYIEAVWDYADHRYAAGQWVRVGIWHRNGEPWIRTGYDNIFGDYGVVPDA